MRIILDEGYRSWCTGRFTSHEVTYFSQKTSSPEEFIDQIRDAEVLGLRRAFSFPFDREVIENLPLVQFIHKSGSGDDWFDVSALTSNGILLGTNRGFNASNVAEHAVTLILLTLRNTLWYVDHLSSGEWKRDDPPEGVLSIRDKTIGIIGLGESGSYVARAMRGLGARVLAYQRNQRPEIEILSGIKWASLDDLLRESDVVSLHVPHTQDTEGMIGGRELELMKPSAVLINCARGKVVDEPTLAEVLASGRLRAAGLDVFTEEPIPKDNPLLKCDRVIATPHIAGSSVEVGKLQVEGTLGNIERFVDGLVPLRLINAEVLENGEARAANLR